MKTAECLPFRSAVIQDQASKLIFQINSLTSKYRGSVTNFVQFPEISSRHLIEYSGTQQ